MSLIEGRGGDLSNYQPILSKEKLYSIEFPDGRPRTMFPIGVSLVAAPFVAAVAWVNPSFERSLHEKLAIHLENVIASIIGAAAAVVFFWLIYYQTQRRFIALAATFIFALCTSMWSTATRGLWQHGPLVLMLVVTMLLLQRAAKRPALVQYASLPLAMAYIIRPTASVPIVVISSYVLIYYRAWFIRYVGWALLVAIPWIAFNFDIYGNILSPYYLGLSYGGSPSLAEALTGNLISPSRGLFVFSPVLLFALSGFWLSLRDKEQRPLHLAYGAIVVITLVAISLIPAWWAGHSFGPRYTTDLIPFFVYFVAFNFGLVARYSGTRRIALVSGIGVLAAVSFCIHAHGAFRFPPWQWNVVPQNIDDNPSRLWDWRDLQFLRIKAQGLKAN
jgi:hypothetical protein